jgi:CubicO group peptidase (beta-lactamase class C family)
MTSSLPRSTPELQGVSSRAILKLLEEAQRNKIELHSIMVLRHGSVIAEGWWKPYAPEHLHTLFSLSKSFTSSAIGFAVNEGLLTEDDTVISFFPDDVPLEVSANLARMRVRDLLSMSSGHADDTLGPQIWATSGNWVRTILEQPVPFEPGTHFVYNTGATFMLSAIIQKVTSQNLLAYLEPRLLQPLGIDGATWESNPDGIAFGGFGMNARSEDIAKFGQLYLQKGVWNGRQILPESWINQATRTHIDNSDHSSNSGLGSDWGVGYGYQFWQCRHGAYRGDGAFGQYCVIMAEQDAVIVMTAGMADMAAGLNLVWDHLLPHMHAAMLEENLADQAELAGTLAHLEMPMAKNISSPNVLFEQEFIVAENPDGLEKFAFKEMADGIQLIVRDAHGTHHLECGFDHWKANETRFDPVTTFGHDLPRKVAGNAAWLESDLLEVRLCYFETSFSYTMRFKFLGETLQIESNANVGFRNTQHEPMTARAR